MLKDSFFIVRLQENSERNALETTLIQASYRHRKKRHQIRKILLVLDYIVECIGCLFIFFVFFIGEKLFLQHVLLSVGTFIYGVPIPFAYLLNESRVRNTIIDEGWAEGFKSIFYSNEKIKQLKRKRIVSYLHPDGITGHCKLYTRKLSKKDDTYNKDISIDKKYDDCESFKHLSDDKDSKFLTEVQKCEINMTRIKHGEAQNVNDDSVVVVKSDKQDDVVVTVHRPTEPSNNDLNNSIQKFQNDHISSRSGIEIDKIEKSSKIKDIGSNLNHVPIESVVKRECLFGVDISLIKSTFPNSYESIFKTLADVKFKEFARTYILNHILHCLNETSNETDYLKHFQYLCCLDKPSESENNPEKNLNLLTSLINAWYLSKKIRKNDEYRNKTSNVIEMNGTRNCILSEKDSERKRIIDLLLFNVNLDNQYKELLEELNQIENTFGNDGTVNFW